MKKQNLTHLALLGLTSGLLISGQPITVTETSSQNVQIARHRCRRDGCGAQSALTKDKFYPTLIADNSNKTTLSPEDPQKSCSGKTGCAGQKGKQTKNASSQTEKKNNTKIPKASTNLISLS